MTRQPPVNPSQNRIAKKTPSISIPKEPQCLARKWYFSGQEIEDHSPSRKDGINHEEESKLRKLYCSFLQELGMEFKVPQVTIATAMMLCHRFYMRQSHAKNDWQTIATASMFLACKVEETSCRLSDVAVVAYKLMYNWDPSAPRRIRERDVYDKWKELILIAERLLLSTIAYDLNIEHPYKPLVAALKRLEISHKDLTKVAWNFVNDWLRTTLCLQYKPHYIAAGSMFLAAKFQRVKLPMEKGKVWWMQFDVSPKLLEEVIQQMLRLLEKNRKQAPPPMHRNVNESAISTSICYNPRSGNTSGSNVAQNTDHGAAMDTERYVKSAIFNSPQSCITSASNITQYTGIGARVDARGLVKSAMSDSPQSCIKSCSNIAADSTGHRAMVDARELVKLAISGSPQSGIISSSTVAWDSVPGAMGNDGGLVKSAMTKCIEDEASGNLHLNMKESLCCQTSDSGSANSVVEDGDGDGDGDGELRGAESDQNSSFRIVSVQGSDSKMDVSRIREALKRRRLDRTANKKLVEAMDDQMDSEAWIEWELENGIELESAPVDKRKRF